MEVSLILAVQSHLNSWGFKTQFSCIYYLESADAVPLHSHNQKSDFIPLGHQNSKVSESSALSFHILFYFIFKASGRQKHFSDFSALRLGTLSFFPPEVRTGIWKGVLWPATGRRGRSFVSFPRPCTTISSRDPGMGKEERSAHTLPPRVPTSRTPAATGIVPPGSGPEASAPGRALPPREVQHPGPGELGDR